MDTTRTETETPVGTEEATVQDGAAEPGTDTAAPAEIPMIEAGEAEDVTTAEDVTDNGEEDAEAELAALTGARAIRSVVASGAAGLVALGLALAALTGTWLGTAMSEREQLIGQIAAQTHPGGNQLALEFGTPWHTMELFNGAFALVGALLAVIVLIVQTGVDRPASASVPWIRAVAWGALVLGLIGLAVAGLMYFDVFTALPHVPATSSTGSTG